MPDYRFSRVASLLGVSDDTVRRWVDAGRLPAKADRTGHRVVEGSALARFVRQSARDPGASAPPLPAASARNQLTGIVTDVQRDGVMAQVELQCGPFRVVSLMSREAADELQLQPGVVGVASVKATNVIVIRSPERG